MKRLALITIAAVLLAAARGDAGSPDDRAVVIGALIHTRLTVDIDRAPLQEVLPALSRATGVTITGRFGSGFEADTPVELHLEDRSALDVLEMVIEQCAMYDPCTWQLRLGLVEAGTKQRLSVPAAAEIRVYPIDDLTLQAPYFVAPKLEELGRRKGQGYAEQVGQVRGQDTPRYFAQHEYASAALTLPAPLQHDDYGGFVARKDAGRLVGEIVRGIVEVIEPGNWDYGQFQPEPVAPEPGLTAEGQERDARRNALRAASRKIARLRVRDRQLIIRAPDFVHRQVNGYPPPLPPPPLDAASRRERSAAASSPQVRIEVLSTGNGGPREARP